jgi:hypothetical protein
MTIFVLQLFRFVIYQVHFKYKKLYRTLICEENEDACSWSEKRAVCASYVGIWI